MRILALFSIAVIALAERPPDVRNVTWGMTRAEVMAAESSPPIDGDEMTLRYAVADLAKSDTTVVYGFTNAKLVRATYIFMPQHANANDFVADFHAVAALLIARHKKPSCERALWLDDSLQGERISYLEQDRALPSDIRPSDALAGLTIALGHVELYSTWNGPRTQILHTMTGGDHRIAHRVEYRSVELFASNQPIDALQPAQVCRP
jgi:hypothetical protein